MKAPEKIYISPLPNPSDGYVGVAWNEPHKTMVEYIRKDAFIEKVCTWLEENKDKYLYNTGEKGEYIPTCSGKMIEDFRIYTEGE